MVKHKYISKERNEYQKKIAVKMWQFMKKWYVKYPDVYRHPIYIKQDFCREYYDKTGQIIDWEADCMLCNIFYDDGCNGCPLHSENADEGFCEDYFKLTDYTFPFHMRPAICDKIIAAIKSYKE